MRIRLARKIIKQWPPDKDDPGYRKWWNRYERACQSFDKMSRRKIRKAYKEGKDLVETMNELKIRIKWQK